MRFSRQNKTTKKCTKRNESMLRPVFCLNRQPLLQATKKNMGIALKSGNLHIVHGNVPFARVPQVIDLFQGFECMRSLGHIITDPHKVNDNQQYTGQV